MSLSLYDVSVPVFTRALGALDRLLGKAEAFAEARKIDPAVLLQARLAPDMFAFVRQVQLASDFAKSGAARVIGLEPPKYLDDEQTFVDLHTRIAKTVAFVRSLDKAAFEGAEDREFKLMLGGQERSFTGLTFLIHAAIPNFFFHQTTAYAILRHNGVEIGKRDFVGG